MKCEVVEEATYRYCWRHLKEGDGRRESEREEWRGCWKGLLEGGGGKGCWQGVVTDESVRQAIIELRPWPRSSATFDVKHHGIRPEIPRLGPCLAIRILRSASCHLCLAAWILLHASCYPRHVIWGLMSLSLKTGTLVVALYGTCGNLSGGGSIHCTRSHHGKTDN